MTSVTGGGPSGFTEIWKYADGVPGWLTREQALLLHEEASQLRPGSLALEIGSHQGRSTVVLAHAVRARQSSMVALDPFVDGRLFGGTSTRAKFERNVRDAGVAETVELVTEYSTQARQGWRRGLDLLYIDGKHDYWTVTDDLRWADHLPPGAAVLVHDAFSSIGVTLGLLRHLVVDRRLAYERRVGSLALFRVRRVTSADRIRLLGQLPWWARNVFIKVLLRLRLHRVAQVFGHESRYDPY